MRWMEWVWLWRAEKAVREGETERRKAERWESREVGGRGVHLSPQMQQKYICRCGRSHGAPAESRNRESDIESRLMGTVGEGEGGTNWESSIDIDIPPRVKQIASEKLLYNTGRRAWPRRVRWGRGGSFRRERTYINIIMIDSGCCTAETNTTL